MCESKVILIENGKKQIVMETAALIKVSGDKVVCTDIAGQEIVLTNVDVREMNLMRHEIILARGR